MKREEYFHYQDDGVEPSGEEGQPNEADVRRRAEQVQQVLQTEGYMYLHKLFVDTVVEADRRLRDPRLGLDELRYEQGRLAAAQYIQSTFVGMADIKPKEEEYVDE